jgi:GMP synthase (glutamine-hydrolysing)
MSPCRLLVVEGNTAKARAAYVAMGGIVMSGEYADLLRELLPGAVVDICYPADEGANLPDGAGLESYDAVAITGSSLNVYDGGPAIERQVGLLRAVLDSGTPAIGSCWGIQVLTVAAGGSVRKNPKGREIGIGRKITLNAAGRSHPMYAGKPSVFDAITTHLDEVETLAPGTTVLASNAACDVQAVEIATPHGAAWGMQYHPEFTLYDIGVIIRRHGPRLVQEGFFANEHDRLGFAAELESLGREPCGELAWRYGIDRDILDKSVRVKEIANWITHQVLPKRSQRGRA